MKCATLERWNPVKFHHCETILCDFFFPHYAEMHHAVKVALIWCFWRNSTLDFILMKNMCVIRFIWRCWLLCLATVSRNEAICLLSAATHGKRTGSWERKEGDWPIHSGLGRKRRNKRDKVDKTDPIFIKRTLTAGLCVLLGRSLLKKHTSHSWIFFLLLLFAPFSLPREEAGTLNYLSGISFKNGFQAGTVGSATKLRPPCSHVTVMWSSLNNSCLWFLGKLGGRVPWRWLQLASVN